MKLFRALLVAASLAVSANASMAACKIADAGEVNIITNFFNALELLAKKMKECATDKLKIDVKLTTEHEPETNRAFEASRSPYDAAAVANSSITPLQAKGQLMPLTDLVKKYKDQYNIEDQMLIKFGDDVMAVAFMVNAQVLFYRKDIFEKHKLQPPKTYDELLADAEILKSDPDIQHPFAAAYGNSWELGNEFVNIFMAMGGELVDPATGQAAFNGDKGLATLELMKKLYAYMSPNALSMDFGAVRQALQQGTIGMAIEWGNESATMDDPKQSKVIDKIGFAPAPAALAGGPPSSLFWWDGYVIPKNLDGDPDLTFRVILEALRPEVVTENNDTTLWIRSNYKPTKYAEAVTATVAANAPPYPMTAQAGLAHAAIGDNIGDALAGKEDAKQSLEDAARAYSKAAKDQGLLN